MEARSPTVQHWPLLPVNQMGTSDSVQAQDSHNRLNHHLYSKIRIGHTEQWPCGTSRQTTEHLLQSCPLYGLPRKGIWPDHTPVARKLYGSLGDLRCAATFIEKTGISIWLIRRRRGRFVRNFGWCKLKEIIAKGTVDCSRISDDICKLKEIIAKGTVDCPQLSYSGLNPFNRDK